MSPSPDDANPLEPLAEAPVPPLDPARRDRIEAALRVQAAARRPVGPPGRRWPVVAPLLLVVALLATVVLLTRGDTSAAALELRDARNVTVTLPDGATVTDPADGFVLAEGAVVTVGAGGSVVIDDVRLAEGAVVRVDDGRLVSDVVATTTTGSRAPAGAPPDDPPAPSPSPTTPATTTTGPERPAATSTTTAERPATTTTAAPERPATTTTTTAPERPAATTTTTTERPTTTTTVVDDAPSEVELALRVRRVDRGVAVDWSTRGVRDGWTVLVLRTTDGTDPVSPTIATVVGRGLRGEVVEARADLGDRPAGVRYRVVVADEAGGIVAASAVQGLPPEGERVP